MSRTQHYATRELETHIRSIYARLEPLARKDGVYRPLDNYFDIGTPSSRDGSFCYSDDEGYHFSVHERGLLRTNLTTKNLTEITFLVLWSDILWMAVEYEYTHRISGQDFRRLMFQRMMCYWNALGPEYAEQAKRKIDDTLTKSPFNDWLEKQ